MSTTREDENSENTCVVCFRTVEIFSIGECDHPVCYECSTRMRVLCTQTECPICRQEMPKVLFTQNVRPYREVKNGHYLADRKFKIEFDNAKIRQAYDTLLDHRCLLCPDAMSFQNFSVLKEHMRRNHGLFYCELCVANLKILTRERRCYTRQELDQHQKTGDPDDRSHKGHPLCKFCDTRYMDKDDLHRHLRRDHLYCHFCDADGLNQYYGNYESLRDHFRKDHYLCEEGTCYEEKFTAVFRTEIDLRAHRASVHGRMIGKAATKQARTLELAFKLTPRPNEQRRGRGPFYPDFGIEEGAVGYDNGHSSQNLGRYNNSRPVESAASASTAHINTDCINEFPSLDGKTSVSGSSKTMTIRTGKKLAITDENFPALGPEATVSFRVNSSSSSDRPKSISQVMKSHPPNLSIHVTNHRPVSAGAPPRPSSSAQSNAVRKQMREDFPSLGSDPNVVDGFKLPQNVKQLNPQWSSGRDVESKVGVVQSQNQNKPKPNPPKQQNFSVQNENFPSLSLKFESACSVKNNEPATSKSNNNQSSNSSGKVNKDANKKLKQTSSSSLTFPVSAHSNVAKTHQTNNGHVSGADSSDVVNKTGNSKKKKANKNASNVSESSQKSVQKNSSAESVSAAAKKADTEMTEVKNKKKTKNNQNKQTKVPENATTNGGDTLERKRTELNIGLANNTSETSKKGSTASESSKNNNASLQKVTTSKPPGFVDILRDKPPPGFDNAVPGPPPGFSIKLNSVARNPLAAGSCANNLTFTNSCGQSFPVNPGINTALNGVVHKYIYPVDFDSKNSELLISLMAVLNDDELNGFREMSSKFRQNVISADIFYLHCLEIMGDNLPIIFPGLIAQLPDIQKQQVFTIILLNLH
ncbi:E3 ubiquitin-protein ligase ZNF598 [Nilaparvata lugens]|uniref:E3 ubiquitin-protein ligase ZNF598 n=1 Tax=Nilaparvata lugens TaxID=108931 RepID=UPI00193CE62D|nr:E3 ubiquitin-protein ligase ZNF598 [Nilaparvata lugens]